jgi:hypothetical protein
MILSLLLNKYIKLLRDYNSSNLIIFIFKINLKF